MFQVDWPTKLLLSHGVVCGMEYLHSRSPHPVIHGDLKIQNVLVGDGLVAKVCITLYIHLWQGTMSCSRIYLAVFVFVSNQHYVRIISNLCTHYFDHIFITCQHTPVCTSWYCFTILSIVPRLGSLVVRIEKNRPTPFLCIKVVIGD